MTGWRMGYLAAPKHFTAAAAIIQSQSTSGARPLKTTCLVDELRCLPA